MSTLMRNIASIVTAHIIVISIAIVIASIHQLHHMHRQHVIISRSAMSFILIVIIDVDITARDPTAMPLQH